MKRLAILFSLCLAAAAALSACGNDMREGPYTGESAAWFASHHAAAAEEARWCSQNAPFDHLPTCVRAWNSQRSAGAAGAAG